VWPFYTASSRRPPLKCRLKMDSTLRYKQHHVATLPVSGCKRIGSRVVVFTRPFGRDAPESPEIVPLVLDAARSQSRPRMISSASAHGFLERRHPLVA